MTLHTIAKKMKYSLNLFYIEILHLSKVLFTTVFGISNFIMFYVIRIVLPSCL